MVTTCSKMFAADLKVLALSEIMRAGRPLLPQILLKLRMNVGAEMLTTSSKCMALVTQHVYNAIKTFD